MNFINALKRMDKIESSHTYIRLLCDFGDEHPIEYTCRRNPCWFADLLFFEQDRELTRLPARLFTSNKWKVCVENKN